MQPSHGRQRLTNETRWEISLLVNIPSPIVHHSASFLKDTAFIYMLIYSIGLHQSYHLGNNFVSFQWCCLSLFWSPSVLLLRFYSPKSIWFLLLPCSPNTCKNIDRWCSYKCRQELNHEKTCGLSPKASNGEPWRVLSQGVSNILWVCFTGLTSFI